LFQTNANQACNINTYINVKGKLWNNNWSILCDGRKRNVINHIATHDAVIGVSSVLWAMFIFFTRDSLLKEDNCYFNVGNNVYAIIWALRFDFLIVSYITRNDYLVEHKYPIYRTTKVMSSLFKSDSLRLTMLFWNWYFDTVKKWIN
jgi:hypothetical protein